MLMVEGHTDYQYYIFGPMRLDVVALRNHVNNGRDCVCALPGADA